MKTITVTVFLTTIIILATLYTINYFTVFGYYLPHKQHTIYMQGNDISAHFTPKFMLLPASDNYTSNVSLSDSGGIKDVRISLSK